MNDIENAMRNQVNFAAYYISQKNYTYDKLCWMLAKRQLIAQKDLKHNQEDRIKEKAAQIYFSSAPYDVICWLIAELDILMKIGKI